MDRKSIAGTIIFLWITFVEMRRTGLQICPDNLNGDKLINYPFSVKTCNSLTEQPFIEAYIVFIEANLTTRTCRRSPIRKVFGSPDFIIDAKNKTIYRRSNHTSPLKISCVPVGAEYLSNGVYFVLHHYSPSLEIAELKEHIVTDVCSNLFTEIDLLSLNSSLPQEKIKFIRRIAGNDSFTGTIESGSTYYASCKKIESNLANISMIKSECYNGSEILTSAGELYYTTNGIDVINSSEIQGCLKSNPYKIYHIPFDDDIITSDINSTDGEFFNKLNLSFMEKLDILSDAFSNFTINELLTIYLFTYIPLIITWCCFIGFVCFYCCLRKKEVKPSNTPNTTYSIISPSI